METFAWRFNDR